MPITLWYEGFDGRRGRVAAEPLAIAVYEHQLYLIARRRRGSVHAYRLSRIRAAQEMKGSFRYPGRADYDPAKVFEHSFGIFVDTTNPVQHLKLRLHPRWRHYVRSHRWHRSQRVTMRGGRLLLEMDVRICREVEAWVMGLGEEAEVLEPSGLRETMARRAKEMARLYR